MSIRAEQIRQALRRGDADSVISLLNQALKIFNNAKEFGWDRGEGFQNPFLEEFPSIWKFLGIEEESLAREAFDAWEGEGLAILSENWRALYKDWSLCFLPAGEIHFDPEDEEFFLISWDQWADYYNLDFYPQYEYLYPILDAIAGMLGNRLSDPE